MNVKPLQAKDVAEKVLFGELFILDVRNETDYEDWKIEGKQVSSINRPYFDLLDGVRMASSFPSCFWEHGSNKTIQLFKLN